MKKILYCLIAGFLLIVGCSNNGPEAEVLKRGSDYVNRGMYDDAIVELDKAIEINPNSAPAYYDRARAFVGKENLEKAIENYTMAISNYDPEVIQVAYNNRGRAYQKMGNYKQAIEDYTAGIKAMPHPKFSGFRSFKATLHHNRAYLYVQKGDYDKAWGDVHDIEALGHVADSEFIEDLRKLSGK